MAAHAERTALIQPAAGVQRLAEVLPEVLDVLDPHREPDQALGDGGRLALPASTALQRRLHPAERRGVDPELGRVLHEVGRAAVRQDQADHPAEARVADLGDVGALTEAAYQLLGVGLRALDPQREGAQSAQREPHLEGPGDRAEQVAAPLEHVVQLVVARDDGAHQHVGVAGDVLRRRVHDQVDTPLERLLQDRRREGVVDDHVGACLVRRLRDRRHVGDLHRRVGRRLEPDQGRVLAGRHDGVQVGDVDEVRGDPLAQLEVAELHQRPVVGMARRDHLLPVGDEVEDRRDGCQSARERQAAPALEPAQRVLERASTWGWCSGRTRGRLRRRTSRPS